MGVQILFRSKWNLIEIHSLENCWYFFYPANLDRQPPADYDKHTDQSVCLIIIYPENIEEPQSNYELFLNIWIDVQE